MLLPHGTVFAIVDGENFELYRNTGMEAAPRLTASASIFPSRAFFSSRSRRLRTFSARFWRCAVSPATGIAVCVVSCLFMSRSHLGNIPRSGSNVSGVRRRHIERGEFEFDERGLRSAHEVVWVFSA